MAGTKVLITGAAGNLGQDLLSRWASQSQYELVGTTSAELNLSWPPPLIRQVLDGIRPDVIVNGAAFTAVDACETELDLSMAVNGQAPGVMASWAAENAAYLLHISTDYVFGGTKGTPYTTDDPTHPVNYYGQTKLAGEQAVQEQAPEHAAVVRTSWLYGSGEKNFVPFVVRSAQNQAVVRIADDQYGTPTWTGNLADMLQTLLESRAAGVFHGSCQGAVSRYDQARFMCQVMGVSEAFMTPAPTASFNFPATRPHNTSLVSSFDVAMPWEAAMERYLQSRSLVKHHV